MESWLEASRETLASMEPGFAVLVDMRGLDLISPEVKTLFEYGQRYYLHKGMSRSVVIVANSTLAVQFKRIALQSNIYDWERYLDASTLVNWEQLALDWVRHAVDPDAERRNRIAARRA
jgi:hypothetical protein